MTNPLPATFGHRPKGHAVTPAQWRAWEKNFDEMPAAQMPGGMPKHPLAKEIYVAGRWVAFQLEKQGVPSSEVEQACCDVGTSALLVMITGGQVEFVRQNLWEAAFKLARMETPKPEEDKS